MIVCKQNLLIICWFIFVNGIPRPQSLLTNYNIKQDCNENFTSFTGSFTTPNYPNLYPANIHCQWLIQLPKDYYVHLQFHSFHTETSSDYIRIYDGPTTSSPLLWLQSGQYLPPVVHSTSNTMLVEFQSDSGISYPGFSAFYDSHVIEGSNATTVQQVTMETTTELLPTPPFSCGGFFYGSGNISTPNYPNNYDNNLDCYWYLESTDYSIYLEFFNFRSQSVLDYMMVYDGWSTSGPVLLDTFSGYNTPSALYPFNSKRILVYFHSDSIYTYPGFFAYFGYTGSTQKPKSNGNAQENVFATGNV